MLASVPDDTAVGVAKRVIWPGIVTFEVLREMERNWEVLGVLASKIDSHPQGMASQFLLEVAG